MMNRMALHEVERVASLEDFADSDLEGTSPNENSLRATLNDSLKKKSNIM
jgi:hypothetical protein